MKKSTVATFGRIVSLLVPGILLAFPRIGVSGGAVFTSQIGFSPPDPKIAVLAVPVGALLQQSFQILELPTGAVVTYISQTGDVLRYPGGWIGSNATGDTYLLDFTRAKYRPVVILWKATEYGPIRST